MGCRSSKPAVFPDKQAPKDDKQMQDQKKLSASEVPTIKLFTYDVNKNNSVQEIPILNQ
jgi:hypothetical protein